MNQFKSIFIIFLVCTISVPRDMVKFILGLPITIEHYSHHIQIGESISFLEFVNAHISEKDHPAQERNHPDHEKIPFHHQHKTHSGQILTYIPYFFDVELKCFSHHSNENSIPEQTHFCSSAYLNNIWQPPRIS